MRRPPMRARNRSTPQTRSAWELGIACALTVICLAIIIGTHGSKASQPHVSVSGTLAEYAVIGRRKSPALRFRLNEYSIDFRVDPSLFGKAMHRNVPPEFGRGLPVTVLVLEDEYLHPKRPPLNRDVEIAWVRGLRVGDREVFGLPAALAWEQSNRRWGYGLFAVALAFTVYAGVKWRRSRARDK
jgi:hypothetical protein